MENGLLNVVNKCIGKGIEEESKRSVERKKNVLVQCRSITSSSVFFLVITWSSLFCLFHLVQGSSATSLVENLHHSSTSPDGSRWEEELDGRRYSSDRYERERDDLEPDDDEIPPPLPSILLPPHRDFDRPRKEARHFKRYPSLSRRILYSSSRRERRQPHKYSVSDFDDEYIPKRSRYMVREDEGEDDQRSRQRFSRHSHEDEEPETLPRTYRRSPSSSDFDQDIEGPSFKTTRSVRPQTGMRSSYNMYDDAFSSSDMMGDHHHRSATNFRRQHDFERPPPENGKEGFGYSRSYYKKYVPEDDYEPNVRTPSNDFQMNKRQPVIFEEPHESFSSFLQGMYGSSPYSQPKAASSSRTGKSMSAPPPWPGLTMDNIPILDPKPVFDKSFMENFLASNNKHFHSDSKDYEPESSSDSNQTYDDDDDSENEESQHHSHRISKPHSQSSPGSSATVSGRLRSFKSFMPFGFGNFFGGSPSSESSQNPRNRFSNEASRVSNIDDATDEEDDSSSHHDSCDSHDSSDSRRHVKFASPEIEIIPSNIKSTSIPSLDSPTSNSTEVSSSLGDQTSTKSPPLSSSSSSSSSSFKNKNISDVSSSNAM